ncbi:MAG: hypothetical protein L0322_29305 [Chloroflexi bacterium]|nr:hypothetical protein [Chloroflexota bacterium]
MPAVAHKHLKPHAAQMRTTHDLEALASLALQIYQRGLDTWQPIVASPAGEFWHIISGHRRQMGQLLALALEAWAGEHPDTEVTIEVARTMLTTLVESLGSLEQVMASLLVKYGDRDVDVVPFEGSAKAEILALQAANYGREEPDMLEIARSFRQALEAGATVAEIARNCGQHPHYVENHLALTYIPPELAQRIATDELPMSVAAVVADLPEPKRTGLAIFILANLSAADASGQTLTAKAIKECATALKKWSGLQPPLMPKHQAQRNIARALVRLWSEVETAYPEDAYSVLAMLIYNRVHEEPWSAPEKLTLWFQAIGGDAYFTPAGVHWEAVVQHLLPEVNCATCPIRQLPATLLENDVPGLPCRLGQTVERCVHGLAPDDPFDVRVPFAWGQHPGVVHEGEYRVKSYEALLVAWQAQAEKEREENEAEAAAGNQEPAEEETTGNGRPQPGAAGAGQRPVVGQSDDDPAAGTPAKDSPIARQRALIASFMKQHEQLAAKHPFATPCGRCQHRLEASPTKDESVPHCAWAGRLRAVAFKVLQAEDKQAPRIPVCRQFAPNQPWNEIIPGHPTPPGVPREWLKEQILRLVQDANRQGGDWNAFEFLTGRPMGANEHYGDWFEQKLDAQVGDLSLEQLFTLFVWAHSEWQRARRGQFSLPVNGNGVQFAAYREGAWNSA